MHAPWLALVSVVGPPIEMELSGDYAIGVSDRNPYLAAREEGAFDHLRLHAGVEAPLVEPLSIGAAVRIGNWETGDPPVDLVVARARWRPIDDLVVNLGRSPLHFGLYGGRAFDSIDQPMPYLARGLYGASGFFSVAYTGVGIEHAIAPIRWDLYGGHLAVPDVPLDAGGAPAADVEIASVAPAGGGRVMFALEQIAAALSANIGRHEATRALKVAASFGLEIDLSFAFARAEVSLAKLGGRTVDFDVYAEGGFRYAGLELSGRFDWMDGLGRDQPHTRILRHHQEIAAAIAYRLFSDHLALKAAYIYLIGNRFARAEPAPPHTHAGILALAFAY